MYPGEYIDLLASFYWQLLYIRLETTTAKVAYNITTIIPIDYKQGYTIPELYHVTIDDIHPARWGITKLSTLAVSLIRPRTGIQSYIASYSYIYRLQLARYK